MTLEGHNAADAMNNDVSFASSFLQSISNGIEDLENEDDIDKKRDKLNKMLQDLGSLGNCILKLELDFNRMRKEVEE